MAPRGELGDLTGRRFGKLKVEGIRRFVVVYRCRCDCGKLVAVRGEALRYGWTKSCGCLRREKSPANGFAFTHGDSLSAEWRTWQQMRFRCQNPNCRAYKNYGGRGITVCERWESYENFLADMGRRPSKNHSINRINNDGPYSPDNCRWATSKQQLANRRPISEEARKNIGAARLGKKHSKKTLAKLSAWQLGKSKSPEHVAALKAAFTDERKEIVRMKNTGQKRSEESKQRMREAALRRWHGDEA